MKKKEIKKIAKIYAAQSVFNLIGSGGYSELLTTEEHQFISKLLEKIAENIQGSKMLFGGLDDIVLYVKSKQP